MSDQPFNPSEKNDRVADFVDLRHGFNRRDFLRLSSIFGASIAGSIMLAACGDATPTPASTTIAATTQAAAATTGSATTAAGAPSPTGAATTAAGATGAATTAVAS